MRVYVCLLCASTSYAGAGVAEDDYGPDLLPFQREMYLEMCQSDGTRFWRLKGLKRHWAQWPPVQSTRPVHPCPLACASVLFRGTPFGARVHVSARRSLFGRQSRWTDSGGLILVHAGVSVCPPRDEWRRGCAGCCSVRQQAMLTHMFHTLVPFNTAG